MNPPPLSTIFVVISIFVPFILICGAPYLVERIVKRKARSFKILALAAFLFFISWYLPSPLIEGKYTAFTTHFVGGGMFTALLWIYIRSQFTIRIPIVLDLLALFFLVSGLGVANELFELAVVQLGIARLSGSDTWWDLFANTTDAYTAYLPFLLYKNISLL